MSAPSEEPSYITSGSARALLTGSIVVAWRVSARRIPGAVSVQTLV